MRRIIQKLKSRSGTSLLYALAVFVVATMVSAVILNSAVTANKRVHDDRSEEQSYLALSSTARLIAKQLNNTDSEALQELADNIAAVADNDSAVDGFKQYAPDTPDPSKPSACVVITFERVYAKDADPSFDVGPRIIRYLGTGTFGKQLAETVEKLDHARTKDPEDFKSELAFEGDGSDVFKDVEAKLTMRLSRMQPDADPTQGEKYPINGVIQLNDESQKLRLSAYNAYSRTCGTPLIKKKLRPVPAELKPGGDPGNPDDWIPQPDELWYTDYYTVEAFGWNATLSTN